MLQLLIEDKIKTRGVLRPLEPEVYLPGNSKFRFKLSHVFADEQADVDLSCLGFCVVFTYSFGYIASIWYKADGEDGMILFSL